MRLFVFLSLIISLCATPVLAETAYERVIEKGKINCGFGSWDPYLTYDFNEGTPKGIVVNLMEAVAEKVEAELVWGSETGWGNMPTALHNGKVDVACSTLWNDPKRGRLVAFTDPLFYMATHAYVTDSFPHDIKKIDDFNNPDIRFSVQEGGFGMALAKRKFPNAQIIPVSQLNSYVDVLLQVSNGKADVVLINSSHVDSFNAHNKNKLRKVDLDVPIAVYGNSLAVSIKEQELQDVLNTAVRFMHQTGEIEKITREFREKYPDEILLVKQPYEDK